MSYRTYINGKQIFGNNEYYPEWIDFIESKGIEVDKYDGFYDGEIDDFMGMLEVVEKISMRIEKDRIEKIKKLRNELEKTEFTEVEKEIVTDELKYLDKSIFDLSNIYKKVNENKGNKRDNSLLDRLIEITEIGYMFMPYALLKACEDKIEKNGHFKNDGHFNCWKIKDGEKINVSAG